MDELGRGTSSRDGLAITLAISQALMESAATVLFATHFREVASVLGSRPGVVSMFMQARVGGYVCVAHLQVGQQSEIEMHYTIADGALEDRGYGIALAGIAALPSGLLERARHVSQDLRLASEIAQRNSTAATTNKRRRLLLVLRETLMQASTGLLEAEPLLRWIQKVQRQFVANMEAT